MVDIYEKHQKAFSNVAAFVILKNNELIGKVNIKYPRDGASRLTVYLHFFGQRMVTGLANGCGYDKGSAAMYDAMQKITEIPINCNAIPVLRDCGAGWQKELENQGFIIYQAI